MMERNGTTLNWQAVTAVETLLAVCVALFAPLWIHRQDKLLVQRERRERMRERLIELTEGLNGGLSEAAVAALHLPSGIYQFGIGRNLDEFNEMVFSSTDRNHLRLIS